MIKYMTYGEQRYMINTVTKKCADIVLINEYNPLGKQTRKYRVDIAGQTVASMLPLPEAKKIAKKHLHYVDHGTNLMDFMNNAAVISLQLIFSTAKSQGFEPREEDPKNGHYTFYNKKTDKFFTVFYTDGSNFSISNYR